MGWVIFLFGSGLAFFVGVGCVLVSIAVLSYTERPVDKVLGTLAAIVGLILIACSATPLPYWLYALAAVVTLPWLVAERSRRAWLANRRRPLRWATAAVWLAAAAIEIPYHMTPTLAAAGRPTLYIIGDSVAAGIGEREETWPRILARAHSVDVTDLSRVGADVASAFRQADKLPSDGGLVLLEIGGND